MSVPLLTSTIVPSELQPRFHSVSEALLDLDEDTIGDLRLYAPLVCSPSRVIVPVEFVVASQVNPLLGVREELLHDLLRMSETERAAIIEQLAAAPDQPGSWIDRLFPPPGEVGFWDVGERFYRTRYMRASAFSQPRLPREVAEKCGLRDVPSYWQAVRGGRLVPFLDTSIQFEPPSFDQPWAFQPSEQLPAYADRFPLRLSVGYRGCSRIYDYPFRPSAFRRFQTAEEAQGFDRLKKFVSNLIVEFLWCTSQTTINPHESESIIQHYKLLPWTYMVDVSYDVNIAKAFAASTQAEAAIRTPALYKAVLYNMDYYDLGASMIENLPFQRPRLQKAISLIALNGLMEDPTGVIVALTEHPFYYTHSGTSWDALGGSGFKVGGRSFASPVLPEADYEELHDLLYPREPDEVIALFSTIGAKVRSRLDAFGLSASDARTVIERLEQLDQELGIRPT